VPLLEVQLELSAPSVQFSPALSDAEMGGSARSIRRRVDGTYMHIYICLVACLHVCDEL